MYKIMTLESKDEIESACEKQQRKSKSYFSIFLRLLLIGVLLAGSLAVFVVWQISAGAHGSKIILDDVLFSPIQPKIGNTIFFHKSNHHFTKEKNGFLVLNGFAQSENYRFQLSPREACAIESAALHNPDADIFVLYESPLSWIKNSKDGLMATINNISNVHLRNLHLTRYIEVTPFSSLIDLLEFPDHENTKSKITQLLGFLSVWRWGGTYINMDTITLQNFEDLETNYAVFNKEEQRISSSIFSLSPFGIGQIVTINLVKKLQIYLEKDLEIEADLMGRTVLNEIFQKLCRTRNFTEMQIRAHCYGLRLYDEEIFYNVPSNLDENQNLQMNFEKIMLDHNKKKWYATYDWENFFNNTESGRQFYGPYAWLAAKNCPNVYNYVSSYEERIFGFKSEVLLNQNNKSN